MEVGARTFVGRRSNNEDALLVAPTYGVFAVADGMGGYEGGEVASKLAITTLMEFFRANHEDDGVTWPWGVQQELSFGENLVSVAVRLANRAVMVRRKGRLASMGSTIAMVAKVEGALVVAHIGDSRVYRLRDGAWERLTRDHSFVEEMTEAGADLGEGAAERFGNLVTRALGFDNGRGDAPTLSSVRVQPGDRFLLSTDGLHDVLNDAVMQTIIEDSPPADAAEALVEAAYAAGSRDNITAIVLEATDE